ncbi:major facilitator superfamily domain-containing protein [Polychytrium aggregatum]|uniref:major facilitator superfamily domain-containing protein n=1 Tax=Polychytrium aggregatum TaxID=110093 RepID=UPI0022FDFC5F|nr:major facilitator superfamily domain-containing protein [Polychytrium aggregatum]KAI9203695.1 major facilitator superfamily domain-containing protein [Polychytrium aggregatum]
MGFLDIIINHWRSTDYVRSEKQLQSETKLFLAGPIPFNRYYLMPAAVLIQICCGSLYAWSGYNLPIEAYIYGLTTPAGVDRGIASITFYIAVAVFGYTAALLGPWLERHGPFRGAMLGAALFFFGQLVTALGCYVKQIAVVYVGYGIFSGAGLGIAYISPVSPLQKWFPEMRGIAAGLAVCGFGAGSIIAPYAQKYLIGVEYQTNLSIGVVGLPLTFVVLGSIYFVVMTLAAVILRMPPPGYCVKNINIETIKGAEAIPTNIDKGDIAVDVAPVKSRSLKMTLIDSLKSREFLMMYFFFLCHQITGLLIISKIQSIVQNQFKQSADTAVNINGALGGFNLLGRLLLPFLSDFFGRKGIFVATSVIQAVCLGLLPTLISSQSYGVFLFCAFAIGMCYGAGFGIIPAFLADQFSSKNVGATHGVILTAWANAGVIGGIVFTAVYNSEKAFWAPNLIPIYNLNFRWILGFVLLGFLLCVMIPAHLADRKLPYKEGEIHRVRAFGSLYRIYKNFKIERVSKQQIDAEWEAYLSSNY